MARVYFSWLRGHLEAHGLTVIRQGFPNEHADAVLYFVRIPNGAVLPETVVVRQRDQTARLRDVLSILRELPGGRRD